MFLFLLFLHLKFLTSVKQHETMWSCSPLNIVDIENGHFCYVLVSALLVENHSRYFDETSHKCKAS